MNTSKTVARLRALREAMGRTGDGSEEGAEAGFTLIELMVVLLIMAILLAIAIPTFLGVTAGAKKTATQSDLTTAATSATAIYSKTQKFPTTATTKMTAELKATQTTITFKGKTTAPTAGKNVISVYRVTTNLLVMSAWDGAGCWAVIMNSSDAPVDLAGSSGPAITPGNHYYGWKDPTTTTAPPTGCTAGAIDALTTLPTGKHTNFKTVLHVT